ncbi:hypothetical protein BDN70DRAFT_320899 [Pholiota conissans]|uniref:Uncharacterized protein n=1 Tax=Pholiota conissans TaxID=109636 RepID=A0A9P6CPV6_9AGAR|nr:hypothetical protein BDN70DRAFT_320899 [Pholiota conissans]
MTWYYPPCAGTCFSRVAMGVLIYLHALLFHFFFFFFHNGFLFYSSGISFSGAHILRCPPATCVGGGYVQDSRIVLRGYKGRRRCEKFKIHWRWFCRPSLHSALFTLNLCVDDQIGAPSVGH